MQTVTSVNCMNDRLRTLNYSLQTSRAKNVQKQTSPNLATKKRDLIKRTNKLSRTHDNAHLVPNWGRCNSAELVQN